jgi:hypothetical protein
MIQARLQYILFSTLLIGGNMAFSYSQSNLKFDDMNLKTNSLNQSEPIYQAISGKFLAAKDLSSTPLKLQKNPFLKNWS